MAHGAPESLDDISPYLQNIMKGRPLSQKILDQIKERYDLVGGKSPLLEITRQQASALEKCLNKGKDHFQVYIGMRHWHPFIHDTIKQIKTGRPDQLVAISLAPQYSNLSVGVYIQTLEKALVESSLQIPVRMVKSWHNHPKLLDAFGQKISEVLQDYKAATRPSVQLLFTAHSLPAQVLFDEDPYPKEVKATVSGILKRLGPDHSSQNWHFAYQSRGFRPGKWLGPDVEEVIGDLGEAGRSDLLVAPIGFVSDHVEILYDVDILYKGLAATQGISLRRTASLNTSPHFIDALADIVYKNLPG